MPFRAPVSEYEFMLRHVVDYDKVAATTKFQDAGLDVVDAILNEAGKMCNEVMAPVQRNGDLHPAVLENGVVRTSLDLPTPMARSHRVDGFQPRLILNTVAWGFR